MGFFRKKGKKRGNIKNSSSSSISSFNLKNGEGLSKKIFYVLLVVVIILIFLNVGRVKGWFIPEQPHLEIKDGIIKLDSMTLEQKIAQMVVAVGERSNLRALRNMQIGGVYLYSLKSEQVFMELIQEFQDGAEIPLFITVDFEGCLSPFSYFRDSVPNSEIMSVGAAFEKGFREGEFLNKLGINFNFAPVVDLNDDIWMCRSFPGTEIDVAEYSEAYILGMQTQGIIATAKHYPGKTLVAKDPHKFIVTAQIDPADIYPYDYLSSKGDVQAVMVSHIITFGQVDSGGVPAVVSEDIINDLKESFSGLVVSDEIHMLGLRDVYDSVDEVYLAVFKAGNDIILNFDTDPNELYRMIQVVKTAVLNKDISEKQIDLSVIKILEAKGFKVE